MTSISFFAGLINMMGNFLVCIYIFRKTINFSLSTYHKVFLILWCLLWTVLSVSGSFGMSLVILINVATIVFIWKMIKATLDTVVSAYLISLGISYLLLGIAMITISLVFAPFLSTAHTEFSLLNFNEPIYLLFYGSIALLQFLLAYLFFRIKRFKNGFPFLFGKYTVVIILIIAGIILAFVSLIAAPRDIGDYSNVIILLVGVIIIGIGIIIWIRRGIKMFYKKRMNERSIEILEHELAEKERILQHEIDQNNKLRIESHRILNRLSSLEYAVTIMAKDAHNAEFSEELSITLEDIKRLSRDYQDGIAQIKGKKSLLSTKIKVIDDLFMYFEDQCLDNKINFNLKVNGSIPYMLENIILQNKLETMIGDHLKDAMIAINASESSHRSILAILGLTGGYYEFTVLDSGIPFEIETLEKLGNKFITTHADSGGSGIGFMTTFDTMRECSASLIINEKLPSSVDYTKSVTIRFDGKNQYIIETYRPDDFTKQDNRYIVFPISK